MKFVKNLLFMFRFIRKNGKGWLFLMIASTLLNAFVPLINIILPKFVVDAVFQYRDLLLGMKWVIILVCITLLSQAALVFLGYFLSKRKNELFCTFNMQIAEHIMDMDYKELECPETLDMREKAMRSAFSGGMGFCGSIEMFFGILTNAIVLLGAAFTITQLNPLLILTVIIVVFINTLFNKKVLKDNYKLDHDKAPIERENEYILNTINDFSIGKEIRVYKLKEYLIDKYKQVAHESNKFYNKAFFNTAKNKLFSATTANIQLVIVYLVLLLQVYQNDAFTFGDFTVQFNAINTLSQSFLAIVTSVLTINQMGFYIDDLVSFINLPKMESQDGCPIKPSPSLHFDFVNVSFKYPGANTYALQNINMSFTSDQKISLVGLNGAGKTTLVKLLLRLYDVSAGEILLNGINIKEYDYDEYIDLFASVFQDYKLFAYSVKENIVFDETIDDLKLTSVLQESGVQDIVDCKVNGVETVLYKIFDQQGFEPSGGEGQKIAIARALYKDASFVILDEPTSALDPLAEYALYEKLNHLVKDKGCMFISHRLSSTVFADKIYVFRDGEIIEQGNHQELMKQPSGFYKEMFEKQASYYVGG